jgi:hypothetical protein
VAGLNATQPALLHSLAYADGADAVVSGLPSGQIMILPTVEGDALLLGNVTYADFQILQQNFGLSDRSWDQGDFDYSGSVDFADFKALAQDFSSDSSLTPTQLNTMNGFAGQFGVKLVANSNNVGFKVVAVPEPASIGLLTPLCLLMLRRGPGRRD